MAGNSAFWGKKGTKKKHKKDITKLGWLTSS